MRKVNVVEFVSLDGVIQAPGGPEAGGPFKPGFGLSGEVYCRTASCSCFVFSKTQGQGTLKPNLRPPFEHIRHH